MICIVRRCGNQLVVEAGEDALLTLQSMQHARGDGPVFKSRTSMEQLRGKIHGSLEEYNIHKDLCVTPFSKVVEFILRRGWNYQQTSWSYRDVQRASTPTKRLAVEHTYFIKTTE
jgi:hypothetical protein